MPETLENAIETASDSPSTNAAVIYGLVVVSLATYGGVDLTRKTIGAVRKFKATRAAKKATETSQTTTEQ